MLRGNMFRLWESGQANLTLGAAGLVLWRNSILNGRMVVLKADGNRHVRSLRGDDDRRLAPEVSHP